MKKTRLYEHANDVHVRATFIYKKSGDTTAYLDQAYTEKCNLETLKDIFEKGAIIVDNNIEYHPISFKVDSNVGTITYVKTDGTTPTTAALATLVSVEAPAN